MRSPSDRQVQPPAERAWLLEPVVGESDTVGRWHTGVTDNTIGGLSGVGQLILVGQVATPRGSAPGIIGGADAKACAHQQDIVEFKRLLYIETVSCLEADRQIRRWRRIWTWRLAEPRSGAALKGSQPGRHRVVTPSESETIARLKGKVTLLFDAPEVTQYAK